MQNFGCPFITGWLINRGCIPNKPTQGEWWCAWHRLFIQKGHLWNNFGRLGFSCHFADGTNCRIPSDPVPQLMSVGPAPVNEQPWAGERWLWSSETYGGGNWANMGKQFLEEHAWVTAEFENYVYISLLGKYQRLFSWIIYIYIYYIYILLYIELILRANFNTLAWIIARLGPTCKRHTQDKR